VVDLLRAAMTAAGLDDQVCALDIDDATAAQLTVVAEMPDDKSHYAIEGVRLENNKLIFVIG
jgi:hypothetical protein